MKVKPSKLLIIFISVLMFDGCSAIMLNCSKPDMPSMLEALQPVFKLSSIRPVIHTSTPTNISIWPILFGILGVDEKAQILTTYIWQYLIWKNEFVSWDQDQCGCSRIRIPRKLLWAPDIVIGEFMDQNSAPAVPHNYLDYDGIIVDSQPVKVVSSCRLDIYLFPFDIQNCSLSFASYLHSRAALQIAEAPSELISKFSKTVMTTVGEWELLGITQKKFILHALDNTEYEELRFYVLMKRRATMYVVNLLIPSCLLITVDLFSFLLPPQTVDRSAFKMSLIMGYTIFLLIVNDLLPITGNTIPLINVFLALCLTLMVASLLESIVVTNLMCGSSRYSGVPRWIRVFVLHILGRLVRLPPNPKDLQNNTVIQNCGAQEMTVSTLVEEGSEVPVWKGPLNEDKALQELRSLGRDLQALRLLVGQQSAGNQSSEEWIQVGLVIDRLLFGVYILFISVSFITIIIIAAQSYAV